MMEWDPQLYMKYGNERTQPAIDLVARIQLDKPLSIIDLGCGTGNATSILGKRWPGAELSGLDSSKEMIDQARSKNPGISWITANIESWIPASRYDLIFSNAALQWVADHVKLLDNLLDYVNTSGVLAIQMPYHYESPLHKIISDVSYKTAWSDTMENARNALTSHSPAYYYDLLSAKCSELYIWQTDYYHIMDSPEAILEWVSGTGLRPYLEALGNDNERERFKQNVLKGYQKTYVNRVNGKVLFPFRRLFLLIKK